MTYQLFLDDERAPEDVFWTTIPEGPWVIVRNIRDFQRVIRRRGIPKHISFDNDLGPGEKEGRHCAIWLTEQILDEELSGDFTFTVHSMNPVAADWIEKFLTSFQITMAERDR